MQKLLQAAVLLGAMNGSPSQATEPSVLEIPQLCDAFRIQAETVIYCETSRALPKMNFTSKGNMTYTISGDTPRIVAHSFGLGDGVHERQLSPDGSIKTFTVNGLEVDMTSEGSYGVLQATFDCIKRDKIDILQCSSQQSASFLEYLAIFNDTIYFSLNGVKKDPLTFPSYIYEDPTTKM